MLYILDIIISCGPHGFKEEEKIKFSYYKSMEAIALWCIVGLDTRSVISGCT